MEKMRMINYLKRRYDEYSPKRLVSTMDMIIERLMQTGKYEKGFLSDVALKLSKEDWPKSKIVAYLDILDIEERT
jgi:hypothetical protein